MSICELLSTTSDLSVVTPPNIDLTQESLIPSSPENDGIDLMPAAPPSLADVSSPILPFIIDPELEHYLPPPSESELKLLRDDIVINGVRHPLVACKIKDDDGSSRLVLLDGHNRYRIWTELGKDLQSLSVDKVVLDNLHDAKMWMLDNQLMKRNLTPMKQSYCRGMAYEAIKMRGFKGNQHTGGGQNGRKQNSAKEIGKRFGVSGQTIYRDAIFAKRVNALSPKERIAVLSGKMKLPKEVKAKPMPVPTTNEEGGRSCTIDDLSHLEFGTPQETAIALSLVIDKADDYIASLPTSTAIDVNCQELRGKFDGFLAKINSKEHRHGITE